MRKKWSKSGDCRNVPEIETCGYMTMNTRSQAAPEADVEPLVSTTKGGSPYQRPPAVEAELRKVLLLSHSDWMRGLRKYCPETLVHLIRQTRLGDPELCGELTAELSRRIVRLARKGVRGRDRLAAEEIVLKVEMQVLELVLTDTRSRNTDFLEISFAEAVAGYTQNACNAYAKTPMGNRGDMFPDAVDEDGDDIERPMELVHDSGPDAEEVMIELQNQKRLQALLAKAATLVEDPRCVEAVVLHVVEGMKVISNDPEEVTLTTHFNVTRPQIQYWLKAGLKAIRKALGEYGND